MSDEPDTDSTPRTSRMRRLWPVAAPVALVLIAAAVYAPIRYYLTHLTTDDARISGVLISIAPSVPGRILAFSVHESDSVRKGQLVARLRDEAYRAEVVQAEAVLARAKSRLAESEIALDLERYRAGPLAMRDEADVMAARATLSGARAALEQSESEFARIKRLSDSNLVSSAEYGDAVARHRRHSAQRNASEEAVRRAEATRKLTNGHLGPLRIKQQQIEAAQADLRLAEAELEAARIRLAGAEILSPVRGIVARTVAHPGERVDEGQTVALVRDLDTLWVVANVSETEVRKGQAVSITVDAFPDCTFDGQVVGIGTATASLFALIPQQSMGGNFVKVVQRVPVRISISDPKFQLKMGLSAVVSIDTGTGD